MPAGSVCPVWHGRRWCQPAGLRPRIRNCAVARIALQIDATSQHYIEASAARLVPIIAPPARLAANRSWPPSPPDGNAVTLPSSGPRHPAGIGFRNAGRPSQGITGTYPANSAHQPASAHHWLHQNRSGSDDFSSCVSPSAPVRRAGQVTVTCSSRPQWHIRRSAAIVVMQNRAAMTTGRR